MAGDAGSGPVRCGAAFRAQNPAHDAALCAPVAGLYGGAVNKLDGTMGGMIALPAAQS